MNTENRPSTAGKFAILPMWVIDRIKEEMRLGPGTWQAITDAVEQAEVPQALPCEVKLPPGTVFDQGSPLSTLLMAIAQRASQPAHAQVFCIEPPAPQPHPEPIAWMVGTAIWWTKEEAERDAAATGLPIVGLGPMAANTTVQQHQGQLVAVEGATFMGEPNFQHSIEWYREGISKHWKKICEQRVSIDALEKQLAEAQALLRIYESFPGYLIDHCEGDTIYEESLQHWLAEHIKSLPASAEPNAPTWSCQPCKIEQPTDRPCDACGGATELKI
ncbi:hypothetical protein [Pseudomonas putida]|uniref:hypothetical protein n=1 Tax=Pseudomonas putida TaxID=303 RepID=UPI001EE78C84|nr:hypothetical protein [Pseudomonas putida]